MKKTVLSLLAIILVILAFLVTKMTKQRSSAEEMVRKTSVFQKDLPPHFKKKRISTAFKDPEYMKAVVEIAKAAKRNGLNRKDLEKKAIGVPRNEFLQKLPRDVRSAYRTLNRAVEQMNLKQQERMKYLRPEEMPSAAWPSSEIKLDSKLEAFVESKKTWRSISDADVQEVITGCGAEQKCIEKCLKIWTDAGQKISARQFEMISKAVRH